MRTLTVLLPPLFALISVLFTPIIEAEFLGCDYPLLFDPSVTSLALKKFYAETGGPEKWLPDYRKGWETEEPCSWNDDRSRVPSPTGVRCRSGGKHLLPPAGDGGLLLLEHYGGGAEGEIPREFEAFQMTGSIGLSFNKLRGPIWDTSHHCFLQKLDLANNCLSGSLPDDFMMRNIHAEIINLAHNQFVGGLPSTLPTLKSLVALLLNDNNFSGEIPDLRPLRNLRHISLGHNNFSGRLGNWISQMVNLGWLEVEHNQLDGPLPELPERITRVNFAGNNFFGEVPESYGRLGYLRYFNCTACRLSCPREDLLRHLRFSSHCVGN